MSSGTTQGALRTRAFGLDLRFDSLDPPGAWAERVEGADDVLLAAASAGEIEAGWSGLAEPGWEATIDGAAFAVERGVAGEHRFSRDGRALALLDPAASSLLCAVEDGSGDAGDWRALLDSVLFSVALLRGLEALHAGAVVIEGHAVAISAAAGGGKSTLLARLLEEGGELLSDDVVALSPRPGERPLAHPGPPLMTVPATLSRPPGEAIADLDGEERWRAVPSAPAPLALGEIVLLDRGGDGAPRIDPVERPLAPLLVALLNFPRTPEREGARFDLAATLAETVTIRRLRASAEASPAELAAVLRAQDFDIDPRHH